MQVIADAKKTVDGMQRHSDPYRVCFPAYSLKILKII